MIFRDKSAARFYGVSRHQRQLPGFNLLTGSCLGLLPSLALFIAKKARVQQLSPTINGHASHMGSGSKNALMAVLVVLYRFYVEKFCRQLPLRASFLVFGEQKKWNCDRNVRYDGRAGRVHAVCGAISFVIQGLRARSTNPCSRRCRDGGRGGACVPLA